MDRNKRKLDLPVVELRYNEGDMIIKQGDYGASIYEIRQGQVTVIREAEGVEEVVAVLGPGEIIGENAFLKGRYNARSASVRAKEACVLDCWHPALLSKEYQQLSPILKHILDRTFKRLVRMNKLITEMGGKRDVEPENAPDETDSCQGYYNKPVDLECHYRPLNTPQRFSLEGKIKRISRNNLQLDVSIENMNLIKHEEGDIINLSTELPNQKTLVVNGEIADIHRDPKSDTYRIGVSFIQLTEAANNTLGFFLMP